MTAALALPMLDMAQTRARVPFVRRRLTAFESAVAASFRPEFWRRQHHDWTWRQALAAALVRVGDPEPPVIGPGLSSNVKSTFERRWPRINEVAELANPRAIARARAIMERLQVWPRFPRIAIEARPRMRMVPVARAASLSSHPVDLWLVLDIEGVFHLRDGANRVHRIAPAGHFAPTPVPYRLLSEFLRTGDRDAFAVWCDWALDRAQVPPFDAWQVIGPATDHRWFWESDDVAVCYWHCRQQPKDGRPCPGPRAWLR